MHGGGSPVVCWEASCRSAVPSERSASVLLLQGFQIGDNQIPGLNWRTIMYLCAVPGVVWAIVFYYWFRDRPEKHRGVNAAELEVIRGDEVPTPAEQTKAHEKEEHADPTPWNRF